VLGEVRQATIAHALMRCVGWRRCEPREPENEAEGEKPQLNAGSLVLQDGVAHNGSDGSPLIEMLFAFLVINIY